MFKGGLIFFHTEFKDKILSYYNTALVAQTFKNVEGAAIQGVEINASYDVGLASGLKVSIEPFSNITYHTRYSSKDDLEISKYGKTLLYTPKWTGAFGIRTGKENGMQGSLQIIQVTRKCRIGILRLQPMERL